MTGSQVEAGASKILKFFNANGMFHSAVKRNLLNAEIHIFRIRVEELRSFVRIVEVLVQDLVHSEHMDLVLLENSAHAIITTDHAFIVWILQILLADVLPDPFDSLRSRKLIMLLETKRHYTCGMRT